MALEQFFSLIQLLMRLRGFRQRRTNVAGFDLSYFVAGRQRTQDPPVVLVHGLGNSSVSWLRTIAPLARRTRVLVPDLPAFGRSPSPEGRDHATLAEMEAALVAFLEAKAAEPCVLVGQSLGGWVAARVALSRPELVGHLILVNTAGVYFAQIDELRAILTMRTRQDVVAFWRRLWHRIPRLHYLFVEDYLHRMEQPRIHSFLDALMPTDFLNDKLSSLRMPVSIIWGQEDRFIPRQCVDTLARELPGTRIVWLPDAGHIPQLEQPGAFNRILLGLLARPPSSAVS